MGVNARKYRGTVEYVRVLAELVSTAERCGLTTYQDIAQLMGLPVHGSYMGRETGLILGEISDDEAEAGRPMLSVVCVSAAGSPGSGLYGLARQMGRLEEGADEEAFWRDELKAVYDTWRRPLPYKKKD